MRFIDTLLDALFTDDPTKTLHYQYAQLIQARNELFTPFLNLVDKITPMSLFTYIKSLFATSSCPSYVTPNPVPPPAPPIPPTKVEVEIPKVEPTKEPEPSCLAKGIAAAWIKGEGWTVKRCKAVNDVWGDQSREVALTHADLDISISFIEAININHAGSSIYFSAFAARAAGITIRDGSVYYGGNRDARLIGSAIMSHPYPALKRLLDRKDKDDATRTAKIAVLEKLGCPNTST